MATLYNFTGSDYKECALLSLKEILLVKVAVQICVHGDTKREILCIPVSEYDFIKGVTKFHRKEQWNMRIRRKGETLLETLRLPQALQKEILHIIPAIGLNILIWAHYHEEVIGFSREASRSFLVSSFFTRKGNIDNKKAAMILMRNKNLTNQQKHKLACHYCLEDYIMNLYSVLNLDDKKIFLDAHQPELMAFWSQNLFSGFSRSLRRHDIKLEGLYNAIRGGSKAGAEYFLENMKIKPYTLLNYTELVVKEITEKINGDYWIVFSPRRRYIGGYQWWIPKDYYTDILCLLLAKMTQNQLTKFLMRDIESSSYMYGKRHSRVLDCFLCWPYQGFFMKTVGLMWEFLPESNYAVLLLKICCNIECKEEKNLKCGEQGSYDFRKLLKDFWTQSPERYKRYVFSNQKVIYKTHETETFIGLLVKLFMFNNFTYEDRENVRLILANAIPSEKEKIFNSDYGKNICIMLVEKEKWEVLDRFFLNCFSKNSAHTFKKNFCFSGVIQSICIDFTKKNKWSSADSFITWCSFSQEETIQLKWKMINSDYGKETCLGLIKCDNWLEEMGKFIRWYFYSEDDLNNFKKTLIFTSLYKCTDMLRRSLHIERVTHFVNWSLSSKEEIQSFKKIIAYKSGGLICNEMISGEDISISHESGFLTNFRGGKWEEVEIFLTWCFSSEAEITDFKKNWLLKIYGDKIHFNLIRSNKWNEAETFFAWLDLTPKEATDLKKETLFKYAPAYEFFSKLLCSETEDFWVCGNKQETSVLFLRWHLADRETVLEFRDKFKSRFDGEAFGKRETVFQSFDLAIEELLDDLDEE